MSGDMTIGERALDPGSRMLKFTNCNGNVLLFMALDDVDLDILQTLLTA